jgi:dihydroxyacetone kinase-like predicted kinase
MENMSVQHSESTTQKEEKEFKEIAYVAVASGEGICELFEEMGVDYVVSGGQTMNPSTEDFIKAFDSLNCNNIIVFPNNSNIIMAAKQAAANYSKAIVTVIETKSIAECYSAISMIYDAPLEELVEVFESAVENATSLEVTYSIRDTQIDEFDIKKGDYLGFVDHKLKAVNANKTDTVIDLLNSVEDIDMKEVLTIFYGNDVDSEELALLIDKINAKFNWIEVGSIEGKQDIYSYIITLE